MSLILIALLIAQRPSAQPNRTVPTEAIWSQGIQLLTEQTYKEAIACGEGEFYPLCLGVMDFCGFFQSAALMIQTPFQYVASTVRADARQLRTPRPPSMAAANRRPVRFVSAPSMLSGATLTVTNIVIQKEGQKLEPILASRSAQQSSFDFPLEWFSPDLPMNVWIATNRGPATSCLVSASELAILR